MKYRKKPIIIEAEQFQINYPLPFQKIGPVVCMDDDGWYVTTIHEQRTPIEFGDWIILEPKGHLRAYPCKPDIFDQIYEKVD